MTHGLVSPYPHSPGLPGSSWSPEIPRMLLGVGGDGGGGPHRQSCDIFSGNTRSQPEGHTRFLMMAHMVQGA